MIVNKTCFKCGAEKPLDKFYKAKHMKDGHLNKCKECTKKDNRANRKANVEHYREYDRLRGRRGSVAEWRAKYPKKYKAQNKLNNAIRDGRLSKPSNCESCGTSERIHGHHFDYDKPLDVMWLCTVCHHKWHNKYGEGANAHDRK